MTAPWPGARRLVLGSRVQRTVAWPFPVAWHHCPGPPLDSKQITLTPRLMEIKRVPGEVSDTPQVLSEAPLLCFQARMRDFPGGPVVKTLRFHCRGHGFYPWLGN